VSLIPAGVFPADIVAPVLLALSVLAPHASIQKAADSWTVVMRVSGGIAGLDREIQLASTGAFTATDRRRGVSATGSMPTAALADVGAIIAKLAPPASKPPSACRDCLVYRFEIKREKAAVTAEFDDRSIAGTPFEALVKTLTTHLTEALRK
jgi:hypothetical protein